VEIPIINTLDEAAKITGLGKTRLYEELNSGRLSAKKAGRRTLIPRASVEQWLEKLASYSDVRPTNDTVKPTTKKSERIQENET
jgi:excisionase family DNA binding protein